MAEFRSPSVCLPLGDHVAEADAAAEGVHFIFDFHRPPFAILILRGTMPWHAGILHAPVICAPRPSITHSSPSIQPPAGHRSAGGGPPANPFRGPPRWIFCTEPSPPHLLPRPACAARPLPPVFSTIEYHFLACSTCILHSRPNLLVMPANPSAPSAKSYGPPVKPTCTALCRFWRSGS